MKKLENKIIDIMNDDIRRLINDLNGIIFAHNILLDRVNDTIKYIENLGTQDGMLKDYKIDKFIKQDLLNILRGEE